MIVEKFNKQLFCLLIDNLNQSEVKYCIIGDYENLPESVGHDIDMWTNDMDAFRSCLEDAMKNTGFRPIIDNETHQGFNIACFKKDLEGICIMKFDVMKSTAYKSFLDLYSSQEMEASIVQYKNFYIASEANEALMHFVYPMFEWGFIKKDIYKEAICNYYQDSVFRITFDRLWGQATSKIILDKISQCDWEGIETMMPKLRLKAILRAIPKPETWKKMFYTGTDLIKRWIKPTGISIAFCGLDGAGKTTILDELNQIFVDLLKSKKVFYGYWRPMVLPEIRVLLGKKVIHDPSIKELQKGKTIIEEGKKSKGKFVSIFKLIYYWIDYLLAPLKYGQIESRGGAVLFDRHYIDMVVHPQRFEMTIGRNLMLLLYRFIKKPNFTFFLWCTPKEILQRKQEFSREDISKMIDDYNEVGRHIKNYTPIHTNTTIDDEIAKIFGYIANKCENR